MIPPGVKRRSPAGDVAEAEGGAPQPVEGSLAPAANHDV